LIILLAILPDDDDDVYLKKNNNKDVTKSNPTQKYRPAKGISKRVNIQIIKDIDRTEQPNITEQQFYLTIHSPYDTSQLS
jgi:hypothetical protein